MKYMVTWSISPEHVPAVLERWRTENPQPGEGCKILERWHVMGNGTGFTLVEVTDPAALARITLTWADLAVQEIVPVLDEAEAIAAFS